MGALNFSGLQKKSVEELRQKNESKEERPAEMQREPKDLGDHAWLRPKPIKRPK